MTRPTALLAELRGLVVQRKAADPQSGLVMHKLIFQLRPHAELLAENLARAATELDRALIGPADGDVIDAKRSAVLDLIDRAKGDRAA